MISGRADCNYKSVLATSVSRSTALLERRVAQAKLKGVVVSCRVDRDYPAFEAVLRRGRIGTRVYWWQSTRCMLRTSRPGWTGFC